METSDRFQVDRIGAADQLAREVGLVRQFMAADLITRGDGWERGVRSVLLQNDLLSVDVVVDRAMDIHSARIRQLPIAWCSPTGVVAPWFVENSGYGTQRSFFGGLLTTCGLDHIGPPVETSADRYGYAPRKHDAFPMHGRISGSPAQLTGYGVKAVGGQLEAFVEGQVSQVSLFGENLVLRRRISIAYQSARIRIEDAVSNEGYATTPLAVLYHVNVGWPVVAPNAEIHLPIAPDSAAASTPRVPRQGNMERVSGQKAIARMDGLALAGVFNPRISDDQCGGLALSWAPEAMPTMLQWDIANIGGNYAVGLEPTTRLSHPREDGGHFPLLEPGQTQELGVSVELLCGGAGLTFSELLNR